METIKIFSLIELKLFDEQHLICLDIWFNTGFKPIILKAKLFVQSVCFTKILYEKQIVLENSLCQIQRVCFDEKVN